MAGEELDRAQGVVLDAAGDLQRFDAARTALEYGFGKFDYEPLVEQGDDFADLDLPYRRDETVKLVAAKDVTALAGPGLEDPGIREPFGFKAH